MADRIVFVGNAPPVDDIAAEVDGADRVVRFNRPRGWNGPTGRRIDDLFLVNCGGQMHEWLRDPGFWNGTLLRVARRVVLPVAASPKAGSGLAQHARAAPRARHGINYEHDVRARLRGRVPVTTLPDRLRRRAIRDLAALGSPPRRPIWPSTGFLAIHWYDSVLPPGARLELHGFGFEGWSGHDWARERAWVERRASTGRLLWHAPLRAAA
jgi:hypothetical protein